MNFLKALATIFVVFLLIGSVMEAIDVWKEPQIIFRGGELSITQRIEGFAWGKVSKRYTVNFASGDKQFERFGRFDDRFPPYQVIWRAECSCIDEIRDYHWDDDDISFNRKSSAMQINTGHVLRSTRLVPADDPEAQLIIAAANQRLAEEEEHFAPIIEKYRREYEATHAK